MLLASFKANSQVVDTTIKSITAMKIQPVTVQVNFPKKDTVTYLGLRLTNDNLKDAASFECILLSASGLNIIITTETISGEDYKTWDSEVYPFVFIAKKYGLTFNNK